VGAGVKRSDIPDALVIELAQRWQDGDRTGVVAALVAEGIPPKLALAKVEHLCDRGLLEYGVSPNYAWPTGRTT
ncbi:MAG TPA: hypothetical protein VHA75_00920, partial [Rugosimonospora sp.]|nr:hypothetical protein [Rugosimonospora sp.]